MEIEAHFPKLIHIIEPLSKGGCWMPRKVIARRWPPGHWEEMDLVIDAAVRAGIVETRVIDSEFTQYRLTMSEEA